MQGSTDKLTNWWTDGQMDDRTKRGTRVPLKGRALEMSFDGLEIDPLILS